MMKPRWRLLIFCCALALGGSGFYLIPLAKQSAKPATIEQIRRELATDLPSGSRRSQVVYYLQQKQNYGQASFDYESGHPLAGRVLIARFQEYKRTWHINFCFDKNEALLWIQASDKPLAPPANASQPQR